MSNHEVPSIHITYEKNIPQNIATRNGYAKKIALIGAFDTLEENPQVFNRLDVAQESLGTDITYNGCKVLDKLFKGASSILAVNITTENNGTRDKEITTTKLTNALRKIKGEDWDTLFIAGILTGDFLPIITSFLDEVAEMKFPAGYISAINEANTTGNINLASQAGEHCYGLLTQSLTVNNTDYDLLNSSAYYAGLIAGLPVGNTMTMKTVEGVTGVTPELDFEVNKDTGEPIGDGAKLVQAGVTTVKCQNRNTDNYIVVNSGQPNGLDLYINRVRDYVVKEMSLVQFLGSRNRPLTLDEVKAVLAGIKETCVNDLDLLKDIGYTVVKETGKCVGVHLESLTFDDIITRINVYVRVEVE